MKASMHFFNLLQKHLILFSFLLGGVLSLLAFTSDSYAMQIDTFPNNNNFSSFGVDLQSGCIFDTYTLDNGTDVFLGTSADNATSSCGYVYYPPLLHYTDSIPHFTATLSENAAPNWGNYFDCGFACTGNSNFEDNPRQMFDAITRVDFTPNTSGLYKTNLIDGYDIWYFALNYSDRDTYGMGLSGFMPSFVSNFYMTDLDGYDVSADSTIYTDTKNFIIEHSGIFPCSDESAVANGVHLGFSGDSTCLYAVIPTYRNYRVEFNQISFDTYTVRANDWYFENGTPITPPSVYTRAMFYSDSYRVLGSSDNFSKIATVWSSFDIKHIACTTSSECDYLAQVSDYLGDLRNSNKEAPFNPDDASGSVFKGWWDIFNFSFIFPFRRLFSSFTNDRCVDIPIIAGMLNTSSRYCTWWSDSVRNTLTPAFNLIGSMILCGFIIHWLNGRSTSVNLLFPEKGDK